METLGLIYFCPQVMGVPVYAIETSGDSIFMLQNGFYLEKKAKYLTHQQQIVLVEFLRRHIESLPFPIADILHALNPKDPIGEKNAMLFIGDVKKELGQMGFGKDEAGESIEIISVRRRGSRNPGKPGYFFLDLKVLSNAELFDLGIPPFDPELIREESFVAKEPMDFDFWSVLDEYVDSTNEEPAKESLQLKDLQRGAIAWLDGIGISSIDDFRACSKEEQLTLSHRLIGKLAGLEQDSNDLLEQNHFNTRFHHDDLLRNTKDPIDLDVLHCKSAIFSEHAVVEVGDVQIRKDQQITSQNELSLPPELLLHLFHNRELLQSGRMSLVPKTISRFVEERNQPQRIFAVSDLDLISVKLNTNSIKRAIFEKGNLQSGIGILRLRTTKGSRIPLQEILEIQDHFQVEFAHFQSKLRESVHHINSDDDTKKVLHAFETVQRELEFLDDRFNRVKSHLLKKSSSHTEDLAIGLYGDEKDSRFLQDVFKRLPNNGLVEFQPWVQSILWDLKHHPYFVPWLIRQSTSI